MKAFAYWILTILVMATLCACGDIELPAPATEASTEATVTEAPTEMPTEPITEPVTEPVTEPAPTEPEHSDLYLPQVSAEDMIAYFNEVVLNMEYTDGTGDATLVQKWLSPIHYRIVGAPTQEDLAVLEGLFTQLNEIPGFPGIFPAQAEELENLTIRFLDADTFRATFSHMLGGEIADGAVEFWYYTLSNELYTGQIGYRTDIAQEVRNSVLLEEVVNLLGISDTVLRRDSIVYQYASDATELSDVDWVILKLLYDPAIQCGMDEDACRVVLETLYY